MIKEEYKNANKIITSLFKLIIRSVKIDNITNNIVPNNECLVKSVIAFLLLFDTIYSKKKKVNGTAQTNPNIL